MDSRFRGLPVIMLSMSRWDGAFSSASISLAKEFSKNNLVFYVDNPFTWKDFITLFRSSSVKKRKNALLFGRHIYRHIYGNEKLIAVTPKLVVPINWMTSGTLYSLLAKINDRAIADVIRKIKKDYQIDEYILFNSFNPFYGKAFPKDIQPLLNVYQSRDDISESVYVRKHGVKCEIEAIHRSDFSMATSLGLVEKLERVSKRPIKYLPNAADIALFKKAFSYDAKPSELLGIDKPVIGYTGNICHRINYDLLLKIALNNKDKLLLLVGPINNNQFYEKGLNSLSNVITTGAKSIEDLPKYLRHIDCAIIPFHCNELTRSIYPLKINEYLAAGKPVVSTNFSKDISGFKDVIYLANNDGEFMDGIEVALAENEEDLINRRIREAESNSWGSRVKLFWEFTAEIKRDKV